MVQTQYLEYVEKIRVPPIKTQGIKTKLMPFIRDTITLRKTDRLVDPFVGSGVVPLNLSKHQTLIGDINPHIISLYMDIQQGRITSYIVRDFLNREGAKLLQCGESHYYEIRDRFNSNHEPLDFLFLNRAGFNGLVRFNRKGKYNVPFCRKPQRFSKSYITKITNQVSWVGSVIRDNVGWNITCAHWRDTVDSIGKNDILYLDPPYNGRHANYYDMWSQGDMDELADFLHGTGCRFALSLWLKNRYRMNEDIKLFEGFTVKTFEHFYHIGSTENLRNSVTEALITNL